VSQGFTRERTTERCAVALLQSMSQGSVVLEFALAAPSPCHILRGMDHYTKADQEWLDGVLALQRRVFEKLGVPPELVDAILNEVPKEPMLLRCALSEETDRGCALMVAAYLDGQLHELLLAHFIDDKKAAEELLDGTGGLATFAARTEIAYLLGLIASETRRELRLIRRTRSDLATSLGEGRAPSLAVLDATFRSALREHDVSSANSDSLEEITDDLIRQITADRYLDADRREELQTQVVSLAREVNRRHAAELVAHLTSETLRSVRSTAVGTFVGGVVASVIVAVALGVLDALTSLYRITSSIPEPRTGVPSDQSPDFFLFLSTWAIPIGLFMILALVIFNLVSLQAMDFRRSLRPAVGRGIGAGRRSNAPHTATAGVPAPAPQAAQREPQSELPAKAAIRTALKRRGRPHS
jgi:hypothetical protein